MHIFILLRTAEVRVGVQQGPVIVVSCLGDTPSPTWLPVLVPGKAVQDSLSLGVLATPGGPGSWLCPPAVPVAAIYRKNQWTEELALCLHHFLCNYAFR